MARVKRTYNLSVEIVNTVRDLAGVVAPTQDAVIERSVQELSRRLRDDAHADLWAQAADDAGFRQESEEISARFAADDVAAWDTR